MFNKKVVLTEGEKAFLNSIYDLILNPNIKDEERVILIKAKENLEKERYFPRTLKYLTSAFRIGAISRNLSKSVSEFYSKLYHTQGMIRGIENGAVMSAMILPIWSGTGNG